MAEVREIRSVNDLYDIFGDGKYQIICISIICLIMLPVVMQQYIMIFLAIPPPWQMKNCSTVFYVTDFQYSQKCDLPKNNWTWVESKSYSIVSEFDLDCDQESFVHLTTMLYFGFTMLGSFFWGYFSDRKGRKKALFYGNFGNITCALVNAFAPNLALFVVFRVINGFFSAGLMMVMVVYGGEIVSTKKRAVGGMFVWSFYSFGAIILCAVSYQLRNWRHILIYCSAPFYTVLLIQWFLPESIAWLFNKRKENCVKKKIKVISKINGREKPKIVEKFISTEENQHQTSIKNFMLLWQPAKTAYHTVKLAFAWIFTSIGYIGVSYTVTNLTGHTYRDFFLFSSSEIVALFIAVYSSSMFGRKKTIMLSMVTGGMLLVVVASIPEDSNKPAYWVSRMVLGVSGKLLSTVVADVLYSWTAETYPTYLRSIAAGFHQSCSLIGMMLAPWVSVWLHRYHEGLPFYCMGAFYIITALVLKDVTETKGKKLTENLSIA